MESILIVSVIYSSRMYCKFENDMLETKLYSRQAKKKLIKDKKRN